MESKPGEASSKDALLGKVLDNYQDITNFIEKEMDKTNRLSIASKQLLKIKITEWALMQSQLVGQIERLEMENRSVKQERTPQGTYAQVVSKRTEPQSKVQKLVEKTKANHTLYISGNNNESGREVQIALTKIVNPTKEKIKIRAIRTTNRTVIIETPDQSDLEKLKSNQTLTTTLKVEVAKKRQPLIILYDVPSDMNEEAIAKAVYEQNLSEVLGKSEFTQNLKLRFKAGPKDKATVHHVVEVSNKIRKAILEQHKLYLGFRSMSAKDYIVVAKCNKCRDLGHVAKHCTKEEACDHCGNSCHKRDSCPHKNKPAICIPCSRRGKSCTKKGDCPTYKMMVERLIQKTNYE
ncbi:hypothetical protein QE152_g5281 [Popillia japonica]|uniref:CCHC-type domain-containing protein n=1 Tax=Popillia japonica TaxID=7064 RepID=A0AAW1MM15_POPJA